MVAQSFILFTKKIPLHNTKLNEHGSHTPNWLNWPVANPATLDNLWFYKEGTVAAPKLDPRTLSLGFSGECVWYSIGQIVRIDGPGEKAEWRNSGNGGIDACLQPETGNKLNRRLNSNGTGTKLQWPN